jgi:plastocyanin
MHTNRWTTKRDHGSRGRTAVTRRLVPVVMVGVALLMAACSSSGTDSPASAFTQPPKASSSSHNGKASIAIRNFAFSPSTTTVTPGATVRVVNDDQVTHTLTAVKGGFTTGDVDPGKTVTFKAPTTPGRYPYMCSIHQYMTGTLVVSG